MRYPFLICGLILAGCATPPQTGTQQLSSKQAFDIGSWAYQNAYPGVSQAEAAERMKIMSQSRSAYPCIRQQLGYAGLVIVHVPDFEIRSYFKGDAEQQLAACTDDANFRAIKTEFSVADLERDKDVADVALRAAGIEPSVLVVPYGHMDHQDEPYGESFTTTDGHVLVSVPKEIVNRAETVLAPLALKTVYVREEVIDVIVPT